VRSRITSDHYRELQLTAKELSKKENTRYIIESSVRQFDDRTRITVQLIDGSRDRHLWVENFDPKLTDIINVQGSIATQVALQLKKEIPGTQIRQTRKIPTKSHEAYDLYLRGRFLLNKSDGEERTDVNKEGLTGSIQYFEKAVAADSTFAEAYACMAKAYLSLAGWGWYQPAREGFSRALKLSMKALEIDPGLAQAHAVKGSVLFWAEHKFEDAKKELLLAIRSSPPYPPVFQTYAQLLMITGPIEEARIFMDRALELEPYYWVLHNLNAWICYFEENYPRAIKSCQVAQELKQDYIFNNWLFFLNYAKNGQGKKAAEELKEIVNKYPAAKHLADEIPDVFRTSGIPGLFNWLIDVNKNRPFPAAGLSGHPFFIAWWNVLLGNREQALYWLERNMEAKDIMFWYLSLIGTNPDFDILRNEPRFLAIIDQIGLKPYHTRKAR